MDRQGNDRDSDGNKRVKTNESSAFAALRLVAAQEVAVSGNIPVDLTGDVSTACSAPTSTGIVEVADRESSHEATKKAVHDPNTCIYCKNSKKGTDVERGLLAAVKGDNTQGVLHWLAMGASVAGDGEGGWRGRKPEGVPILAAIEHNSLKAIRVLIQQGAEVNQECEYQETPLKRAINSNNVEAAQILLDHGADVHGPTSHDYTVNWSMLMNACHQGNVDMVKMLIKHGARVDDCDQRGETALSIATGSNRVDIMEVLVEHGADVLGETFYYEYEEGKSMMMLASESNCYEAIQWFINHGVDVNHKNGGEMTALFFCRTRACAEFLLRLGADVDATNWKDDTPLTRSFKTPNDLYPEVVKCLVEHGANVNHVNSEDETPLWLANQLYDKSRSNLELVRLLIKHGADVHHVYDGGGTLLTEASRKGNVEVMSLLLKHGANVNATDDKGYTPLMKAARGYTLVRVNCLVRAVRLLIAHGADVHRVNHDGSTALSIASCRGNMDIMCKLIHHGAALNLNTMALERCIVDLLEVEYLRYSRVDVLRILLREGGRQLTARAGQYLPIAIHRRRKSAIPLLTAAALTGRIG